MNLEISKLIQKFSSSYLSESKGLFSATSNSNIITWTIPNALQTVFALDKKKYKIYGSVGKGNWCEIPWIALLDREVTDGTERGYYIALLFDKNMQDVYLSLMIGWTQFKRNYGSREGLIKINTSSKYCTSVLSFVPNGFKEGSIDLHALGDYGKGYQEGSIISKKYQITNLSDVVLFDDIRKLLEVYHDLKNKVGSII